MTMLERRELKMASNDNNQKGFTQQQEMHTKNLRGPQHLNEHADFITSQPAESKGRGADRMPAEEPGKEPLVYDPQYILQTTRSTYCRSGTSRSTSRSKMECWRESPDM